MFLKEVTSASPANTLVIGERDSLVATRGSWRGRMEAPGRADGAQRCRRPKPRPEQGPPSLRGGEDTAKENCKPAEARSGGSGREAVSTTPECRTKQPAFQKIALGSSGKAAAPSSRFSVWTGRPALGGGGVQGLRSQGGVWACLNSFRAQAGSLVRGQCSWRLSEGASAR